MELLSLLAKENSFDRHDSFPAGQADDFQTMFPLPSATWRWMFLHDKKHELARPVLRDGSPPLRDVGNVTCQASMRTSQWEHGEPDPNHEIDGFRRTTKESTRNLF